LGGVVLRGQAAGSVTAEMTTIIVV
jgi:hypothetical protein